MQTIYEKGMTHTIMEVPVALQNYTSEKTQHKILNPILYYKLVDFAEQLVHFIFHNFKHIYKLPILCVNNFGQ
jgi:hypothetical protein